MKLLLAPLFFRQRFCKHCARSFYRQNPGSWLGLFEFESLPPLGSFEPRDGFIPDFPVMTMFDEFVVDSEAYERLRRPNDRPWLHKWSELVAALEAEGALAVEDVPQVAKRNGHSRAVATRKDVRDPARWVDAMLYYDALTTRAHRLLGTSPQEAAELAWDFDPDALSGVPGSDGHVHALPSILSDGPDSDSEAHRQLYGRALAELKAQLAEVNACLAVCDEMSVAPMMWAPYRRYLEAKLHGRPDMEQQDAASKFFSIAFPAYSPTTVSEFVKLRSSRSIVALRTEIVRASETAEVFDPSYPQRVLTEALRIEVRNARMRKIVGWFATVVGMIPAPGLGLAASVAGEGLSAAIEKRKRKPLRWFYVISDGRGIT